MSPLSFSPHIHTLPYLLAHSLNHSLTLTLSLSLSLSHTHTHTHAYIETYDNRIRLFLFPRNLMFYDTLINPFNSMFMQSECIQEMNIRSMTLLLRTIWKLAYLCLRDFFFLPEPFFPPKMKRATMYRITGSLGITWSTEPEDSLARRDAVLVSSVPWGSLVLESHRWGQFLVTSNFCRNKKEEETEMKAKKNKRRKIC